MAAMGGHSFAAETALIASRNAGDDDLVADVKVAHSRTDLLDDSDGFMAQNAALRNDGEVSFEDMKIGAADSGSDTDDGVAGWWGEAHLPRRGTGALNRRRGRREP